LKRFLKNYFSFNRRERNGALVLCFICLLLLTYLYYLSNRDSVKIGNVADFEKEIAEFKKLQQSDRNTIEEYSRQNVVDFEKDKKVYVKAELFEFDPNNLPDRDWRRLGFSDKQIKSIKNYEAKGGRFYDKEDVKKMYSISPEMYASIEPYIHINTVKIEIEKSLKSTITKREIELNSANAYELLYVPIIDSITAINIIKYRSMLGGFYNKEQLKEVQNLDTVLYDKMISYLSLNNENIRKFDINYATIDQLKKHPYIRFSIAKALVLYRETHGTYKSVADIKKCVLVNEELFRKIAPYLTVEE
jgi:DNA uptake protein ComE-like DNA-binding protein